MLKNPHFSREFNAWELDEVESFLQKLQSLVIKREVEDKLRWNESKCSKFSDRSLHSSFSRRYSAPFPAGIVWRSWASINVSLFA